jgi:hypothetical protein
MQMKNILLACLLLSSGGAFGQQETLPVVPQPKNVRFHKGSFPLHQKETSIRLSVSDTTGIWVTIRELQSEYEKLLGEIPSFGKAHRLGIHLGIPSQSPSFERLCDREGIILPSHLGQEGYSLAIRSDQVLIAANDKRGLFYGVQTLKQLLRGSDLHAVRALTIIDWPDLRLRGVSDDISRGPLPTTAFIKQQIRRAAELKLNFFTHYIEHVVATKSHPDFAPPGAITIEEWRELSEYARLYHVELVGGFQSFGHFHQILSHPQYAHLAEGKGLLSPMFEESYQFLSAIYSEMIPAFRAGMFNVHCDETFDLGKGASRKRVDSLGIGFVYAEHINRLHKLVRSYGVRMMMWADVVLEHPEILRLIPKDVILMPWNYDARPSFADLIEPLQKEGFDVIATTGVLNSFNTMPNYRQSIANIRQFTSDAVRSNILGVLNTVWDDGGSAMFSRDWYGVAYGADRAWHSSKGDTSFNWRFDRAVYGELQRSISEGIEQLSRLAELVPTDGMNEKVFWTPLIPEVGQTVRINMRDWDEALAIVEEADRLFIRANARLFAEDIDAFRYIAAQYRYMVESRTSILAAAQDYRDASLMQRTDRSAARTRLLSASQRIATVRESLAHLKDWYTRVWLRENRMYALDVVLDQFEKHLSALRDTERRIGNVLNEFDAGLPVRPPDEVRIAVEETNASYFSEWLVSGPIHIRAGERASEVDYLQSSGGESKTIPAVAQEFEFGNRRYRWHRFVSSHPEYVDLEQAYELNKNVVLYAHATLESPAQQTVKAHVGFDDALAVFVNGVRVFADERRRGFELDNASFEITLKKGRNDLLLKSVQIEGERKFSFRLADHQIRNRKNRYRISP